MFSNNFTFPQRIIPLKLVVKFEPPIIGILYIRNEKEKKKHIYNILLNEIINNPNTKEITAQLYREHEEFLNTKLILFE